jgi:adenosine deaminase
MKAVEEQGLEYPMLKTMARTSLEHSFLAGGSLWSDGRRFVAVKECAGDRAGERNISQGCKAFLKANERANEQWKLEKAFTEFEAKF